MNDLARTSEVCMQTQITQPAKALEGERTLGRCRDILLPMFLWVLRL